MGKEQKVLKNDTKVFYSIRLSENLYVTGQNTKGVIGSYYISNNTDEMEFNIARYQSLEKAIQVARIVGGKIHKNTIHKIETEEIEEVTINEQPTFSN